MTDVTITPELVHGGALLEPGTHGQALHRLPAWARRRADQQLLAMESQPSGVRLVVRTAASTLELVTHANRVAYAGADRPRGSIDVVVDGESLLRDVLTGGDVVEFDFRTGRSTSTEGAPHTTTVGDLPAGEHVVELWLPHNETIELVALRADAEVHAVQDDRPRWLHHGSSISQGSNAATPTGIWPVVAAASADVDLRNLGFGGSALVDPFVARVMRDTPADVISVALGINVVNADAMRLRAFVPAVHGFLDTIRDGHPTTPILLVSPIHCGIHESSPGPGAVDVSTLGTDQVRFIATGSPDDVPQGRLTLEVIRRALAEIVEQRADAALTYVEGLELYGADDAVELPLADALHPGPEAHRRIGERFAATALAPAVLAMTAPGARLL